MHIYFIKWHDGRVGKASNAMQAIERTIGTDDFRKFVRETPIRGYEWTGYVSRQSKYETCTINHNAHQLAQVFRATRADVIKELEAKYKR